MYIEKEIIIYRKPYEIRTWLISVRVFVNIDSTSKVFETTSINTSLLLKMLFERLRFSSLINISFINSVLTTTYTSRGQFIANVIHRYHSCYAKCRPDGFKIIKYRSTAPVFNGWQFTSCMTINVISKNMCNFKNFNVLHQVN